MNDDQTRTRSVSFSCMALSDLDFHEQYCEFLVRQLAELLEEMIPVHGQDQAKEIFVTAVQKVEGDILKA